MGYFTQVDRLSVGPVSCNPILPRLVRFSFSTSPILRFYIVSYSYAVKDVAVTHDDLIHLFNILLLSALGGQRGDIESCIWSFVNKDGVVFALT